MISGVTQLFCYDEQNHLVWAGATDASPCNGPVSSGSLTNTYYSQAYSYDAQGRLTSGAIGSYVYGDASHPHAVTSIGGGTYTARYDAAGDMTCRAPNSSVTCAGTPTGATMSYDAERRLADWQNTPTTPTVQAASLYDGEGNRIEQWVNTSGVQTTTGYLLGGLEERTNAGVITKYLGAKGLPTAIRVGVSGSLNYLTTDGLGSVSVAVDGSGNVVASQVYAPYGTTRYSSGTMPTSKGFTGQRADVTSGLDYYNARYYDPQAGQFVSADSMSQGLSRYAYVGGNPETATDPSGHLRTSGSGAPPCNSLADCTGIQSSSGGITPCGGKDICGDGGYDPDGLLQYYPGRHEQNELGLVLVGSAGIQDFLQNQYTDFVASVDQAYQAQIDAINNAALVATAGVAAAGVVAGILSFGVGAVVAAAGGVVMAAAFASELSTVEAAKDAFDSSARALKHQLQDTAAYLNSSAGAKDRNAVITIDETKVPDPSFGLKSLYTGPQYEWMSEQLWTEPLTPDQDGKSTQP